MKHTQLTMFTDEETGKTTHMTTHMTNQTLVLNHMKATGSISIREAMDDYGLSGGHLTKIISNLKRSVTEDNYIMRKFNKHPITGRRYARYHLVG